MTNNATRQPDERERANKAVELRIQGLPYRTIADQLGYADESGARHAVTRLLDRREAEGVGELRAVHSERLEMLLSSFWVAAVGGDADAAKVVLRALESLAKLWGTNAPTHVRVGADDLSAEAFANEAASLIERITALGGTSELRHAFPGVPHAVDPLAGWSNIGPELMATDDPNDEFGDLPEAVVAAAVAAPDDAGAAAVIAAYRGGNNL